MCEQMSLTETDFTGKAAKEQQFLTAIFPDLRQTIESTGADPDLLKNDALQAYSVVAYHTFTCFRLKLRGKTHFIGLPSMFKDMIPEDMTYTIPKSDSQYYRLPVDADHPIESYTAFLNAVVKETINRFPKEWDCCSRYEACSDAKHCIHPDKTFALGCGYRKILNSGRIFYGKNRNID